MHNNYRCVAEYIWLDANKKFRSKTKVIPSFFSGGFSSDGNDVSLYPRWDYDGSSTGQTSGEFSEIILVPVFVCDNPLSQDKDNIIMRKLVWCETFHHDNGMPTPVNTRHAAMSIFDVCLKQPLLHTPLVESLSLLPPLSPPVFCFVIYVL